MECNIVLLAGGEGKRLWPLSNKIHPKQFIILPNIGYSSFQLALLNSLKVTFISNIIIITNHNYKHLIEVQLKDLGLSCADLSIIFEASSDNTGKAVYRACCFLKQRYNDYLTYFLPTDHGIYEDQNFLLESLNKIDSNKINIFGQYVVEICSMFGYIISGKELASNYYQVDQFIEKPNNIERFLAKETYRNLGIYLARPSILYKEFHNLYYDLKLQFKQALSIDKIISEKSKNLNFLVINFNWYDIGSISDLHHYCGELEFVNCKIELSAINEFNENNREFKLRYNNKLLQIIRL